MLEGLKWVCVVIAGLLSMAAGTDEWTPSNTAIRDLERRLVMPSGASAVDGYDRYYTGEIVEGRRTIVGTFYSVQLFGGRARHGKKYVVKVGEIPMVNDGGCEVVHVYADEDGKRVRHIGCNGEA